MIPVTVVRAAEVFIAAALLGMVVFQRRRKPLDWNPGRGKPSNFPKTCMSSQFKPPARKVNDSLYELHKPEGVPTMEVVFFHGLQFQDFSEAHLSTWESGEGSCICPGDWLAEEFPYAHILGVSYVEGLRKDYAESFDIRIVSENFINDLIHANIGQRPDCPVVLVGHSFGGLVIKELCLRARKTFVIGNDVAKVKKFLDNLRGVFNYSIPHHGNPHIETTSKVLSDPFFRSFTTLSIEASRLKHEFNHLRDSYPKWQIEELGESVMIPESSDGENSNQFATCRPENSTSRKHHVLGIFLHNISDNFKLQMQEEAMTPNKVVAQKQMINMDVLLKDVENMLKRSTTLGIVGMGGLGKTTLAKVVFNELSPTFEYTSFVSDVKLIEENLTEVKKVVWKHMHCLGRKVGEYDDLSSLTGKRLLLVLDDILDDRDITLVSHLINSTSPQSRFIVTSCDRMLLSSLDEIYQLPLLDQKNAQKLFVSHAFPNQTVLPPNLECDGVAIVEKCGGLPLTLEVLGRHLKLKENEKLWKQTLQALERAEVIQNLDERLWAMLRVSYDGLNEVEQQMFLDFATLFSKGIHLREAKAAWREAYGTQFESLWDTLVERSLVYNVEENDSIKLHDQLLRLGQLIASESSMNRKRKYRVWEQPKALKPVQNKEGKNQDVHALGNLAAPKYLRLNNCQSFETSPTRFGDLSALQELELIDCCQLQELPDSFGQLVALQKLTITSAYQLETLSDSFGNLASLKYLSLKGCRCLKRLPENFGRLFALQELELEGFEELQKLPDNFGELRALQKLTICSADSLEELPKSFSRLPTLQELNLKGCGKLQILPHKFCQLSTLERLSIQSADHLKTLSDGFGKLVSLTYLSLRECQCLERLPVSFGLLPSLEELELDKCTHLRTLPDNFGQLKALKRLIVEGADHLEALPNSFGNLAALKYLRLSSSQIFETLPKRFGDLSALQELELMDCCQLQELPDSFGHLRTLQKLTITRAYHLETLSDGFGDLASLQYLSLKGCRSLKRLPESFGCLFALQKLEMEGFESLQGLPGNFGELTLQELDLKWCGQLQRLPDNFGALSSLERLSIHSAHHLESLSEGFGNLVSLKFLSLKGCRDLEILPESFGLLSALQELELEEFEELQKLPYNFGRLRALQKCTISSADNLEALPESFCLLSALQELHLKWCGQLRRLPDNFGALSSLKILSIKGADHLEALPEGFGNLPSLEDLYIGARILPRFPKSVGKLHALRKLTVLAQRLSSLPEELGHLSSLQILTIQHCRSLETLPDSLGYISSLRKVILQYCSGVKSLPDRLGKHFSPHGDTSAEATRSVGRQSSQTISTEGLRLHIEGCPFLDDSALKRLGWIQSDDKDFFRASNGILHWCKGKWFRRKQPGEVSTPVLLSSITATPQNYEFGINLSSSRAEGYSRKSRSKATPPNYEFGINLSSSRAEGNSRKSNSKATPPNYEFGINLSTSRAEGNSRKSSSKAAPQNYECGTSL